MVVQIYSTRSRQSVHSSNLRTSSFKQYGISMDGKAAGGQRLIERLWKALSTRTFIEGICFHAKVKNGLASYFKFSRKRWHNTLTGDTGMITSYTIAKQLRHDFNPRQFPLINPCFFLGTTTTCISRSNAK